MTTKRKIPLGQAQQLARELTLLHLRPACERIEIAGSIRRGKPEVSDVELVAIPRFGEQLNLFGEPASQVDLLRPLVERLLREDDAFERGPRNGDRYVQFFYQGCKVDLFIVKPPAQWGVLYTIRTGPAAFSKRLVTPKKHGGLLPSHLKVKDGAIWDGDEVIPTAEEEDVFRVLGLAWIAPHERK